MSKKKNIEKKCRRNKSRKMHISISDQNVQYFIVCNKEEFIRENINNLKKW